MIEHVLVRLRAGRQLAIAVGHDVHQRQDYLRLVEKHVLSRDEVRARQEILRIISALVHVGFLLEHVLT